MITFRKGRRLRVAAIAVATTLGLGLGFTAIAPAALADPAPIAGDVTLCNYGGYTAFALIPNDTAEGTLSALPGQCQSTYVPGAPDHAVGVALGGWFNDNPGKFFYTVVEYVNIVDGVVLDTGGTTGDGGADSYGWISAQNGPALSQYVATDPDYGTFAVPGAFTLADNGNYEAFALIPNQSGLPAYPGQIWSENDPGTGGSTGVLVGGFFRTSHNEFFTAVVRVNMNAGGVANMGGTTGDGGLDASYNSYSG
jgi:hypothetical protein